MRLIVFKHFFLWIVVMSCLTAKAQDDVLTIPVTFQVADVPLNELLSAISDESGVFFAYNSAIIPPFELFTYRANQLPLGETLDQIFIGTGLDYKVVEDQIIITKKRISETTALSTLTIFGSLIDVLTNEPVEGANIFIANTLKGDASNSKGYFEIKDITPGTYELIISHIGYQTINQTLSIRKVTDLSLKIEMQPRVTQLPGVSIKASPVREWQEYYEIFEREFLGSTPNAARCYILNKDVLDFKYDPVLDLFIATAYEAIQIENLALGYRIDYVLEEFQKVGDKTKILGSPRFFELTTDQAKDKKRWRRNRQKSYAGSLTHFLHAMCNDRLGKEGFLVYKVYDLPVGSQVPFYNVDFSEINRDSEDDVNEKLLSFEDYLQVIYTSEQEHPNYVEQNMAGTQNPSDHPFLMNPKFITSAGNGQVSYLQLNIPTVRVDKRGFIYDPLAVTTYGYWSWERIAEILPIEYKP